MADQPPDIMSADPGQAYVFLREKLPDTFSLEELKDLCGRLDLNYESVPHGTLGVLADGLLRYTAQRGRQAELIAHLRRERAHITWPESFDYPSSAPSSSGLSHTAPSPNPSHREGNVAGNPFGRTGRLNGPPEYLVRQPFTDEVIHELRKGVSLSIVGETQTGKSSLLWYLTHPPGPESLGRAAADCVYLDMQLLGDEHDFFDALCDELGISSARGYKLGRALRGRNVLLAIDEVEKMTWDGFTRELRTQLRGLADGPDAPLTLVIASRTPLSRLFPDGPEMTSPLAGLCLQLDMRPFTLAETRALVDAYLRGRGQTLSAEAIEAAWRASGGYPARLQGELRAAFDRAYPTGR
jgi:hypothetical protein